MRAPMRGGGVVLTVAVALALAQPPAAAQSGARLCDETLVEMSDGVGLHTWVSRVAPDRPRPVLLEIESYARPDNGCPTFLPGDYYPHVLSPEIIDRFTLVHVSYRGTGSSEGVFDLTGPRTQSDVAEIIAWAAEQPWSNGDVVLTGQSGTGFAAFHGLGEPAVKAAVIYTSCPDMYRCFRRGGTVNGLSGVYLGATAGGYLGGLEDRRRLGTDTNPDPVQQQAGLAAAAVQTTARAEYDDYWAARSALEKLGDVDIPVMYSTDAYDIVGGAYDAFQLTPDARLVLGMGHTTTDAAVASDGRHARLVRRWVDRFVARYGLGVENGAEDDPRVVTMTNLGSVGRWRAGDALVRTDAAWPLPRTRWTRLFLDPEPSGTASSLNDGSLSAAPPAAASEAVVPVLSAPSYRADQRTFAWLLGGGARTDFRDDERTGLTYTTPQLSRDVEITGPITLRVVASSTAPDFDWVVRLTDVWPDGRSEWITDGFLRAAVRDVDERRSLRNRAGDIVRPWHTFSTAELVPPGDAVEYLIEVIPTSNIFRKGHRLRLDVVPVANGGPDARAGGAGVVRIHQGGEDTSSIMVPIIPTRCARSEPLLDSTRRPGRCARSWRAATSGGPVRQPVAHEPVAGGR